MTERTTVSARDKTKRNSSLTSAVEDESTVLIATASRVCYWNDTRFEEGSEVQVEGEACYYMCSLGHWVTCEDA